MHIVTVLEHSDECSGTWITNNGTKCHWTEGRSSDIICILPNGKKLEILASTLIAGQFIERYKKAHPENAELIDLLIDTMDNGPNAQEWAAMTPEQEQEHEKARS